jgi:hypothetical protein
MLKRSIPQTGCTAGEDRSVDKPVHESIESPNDDLCHAASGMVAEVPDLLRRVSQFAPLLRFYDAQPRQILLIVRRSTIRNYAALKCVVESWNLGVQNSENFGVLDEGMKWTTAAAQMNVPPKT